MYKLYYAFLLLLIPNIIHAQKKNYEYSFKAQGCLVLISITSSDIKHSVSKNKIQFAIEIANFDTSAKYFRVIDSDSAKLLVNFSDLFLSNKEVNFHIGGCIESTYPQICEPRTFIFEKVNPREKISAAYTFNLKHPFEQYTKSFQIGFLIRYVEKQQLPATLKDRDFFTLSFDDFYSYSSVLETKINTQYRVSVQE
jgi:hypothetical protein